MEKMRETLQVRKERAILVAAIPPRQKDHDDLKELTALAETAGAIVVDRFQQKIHKIHPALYIGKGKVEQLAERVKRFNADLVIFDNDLLPRQVKELEELIGTAKVIDRSELILDIFATGAKTAQAKLQVELAQLEYTYPRLARMWSHLDTSPVRAAQPQPEPSAASELAARANSSSKSTDDLSANASPSSNATLKISTNAGSAKSTAERACSKSASSATQTSAKARCSTP